LFVFGTTAPQWAKASSFTRFLDHTQQRTTVGKTPVEEWSVCRRDLYLTTHTHTHTHTHKTQNRQTSMPRWELNPQSQQASGRKPMP
jgi:hypothetical protein